MQNHRQLLIVLFMLFTMLASANFCLAIPTQFGDSGLISQPTAETLNSGNICVGIIGNCTENDGKTATVLPFFMTLGLGSFLEAYGSYPNVLFNEKEEESGRGFSNVGMKIRVFGKRSSQFKFSLDGQLRRTVSNNINYDGLTDQVYRAIASYNYGKFGLHGNAGYINPESPQYISYDKQLVYGGGLEYLPTSRLRLLTEIGIESSKSQGLSDFTEVTVGLQYFLSPHLTLNVALAKGLADESPDSRVLFGFSSCQGIGTYQRPVPRKVVLQADQPTEEKIETKVLKVRTLKPLSPKKKDVEPVKSSSKYEVSVGQDAEIATLSTPATAASVANLSLTGGAAITAVASAPLAISSGIPLLQVVPEISGSIAATALALPVNETASLPVSRPSRSYKLNEVVKTDANQVVGMKIVADPRYQAEFHSITETPTTFSAIFSHKFDKSLDVWIEGSGKGNSKLSQSKAAQYDEITLTVDKVNGKVPYFKLHIGELSEIFEFYPLRKSVKLGKVEINIRRVQGAASVVSGEPVSARGPKTLIASAGTRSAPILRSSSINSRISASPASGLTSAAVPAVEAVPTAAMSNVPSAGTTPFPAVLVSPKSDEITTNNPVVEPLTGNLTGVVLPETVPEAELKQPVRAPVQGPFATAPSNPVQVVAYKKFRLPSTVIFAFDDATLTEEGKVAITDVVEAIKTETRWYVLRVDGFTDNLGSDDYNIKLGLKRAISVAKYMVMNNGIDPAIIFVKSSGENDPIETNETEEGRTLNRRSEIVLFVQKEE